MRKNVKDQSSMIFSFFVMFLLLIFSLRNPDVLYAAETITISADIESDTAWDKSGNTYALEKDVQIRYGTTVTIGKGVTVQGKGHSLKVFGTLNVDGAAISDLNLVIGNTGSKPCTISLKNSELTGGSLFNPTGQSSHAALTIEGNRFTNLGKYSYIWYPEGETVIRNNSFEHCGGLSIGSSNNVYITNNLFHDMTTDYTIINWAQYENSNCYVENNSFYSKGTILQLKYDSGRMIAKNNYWNTTDASTIKNRIIDRRTDFSIAGTVTYEPWLEKPAAGTPEAVHKYGDFNLVRKATCRDVGLEKKECACGDTITRELANQPEHKWNDGVVTVEATDKDPGVKTYTCLTCGSVKTVEIPKKSNYATPETSGSEETTKTPETSGSEETTKTPETSGSEETTKTPETSKTAETTESSESGKESESESAEEQEKKPAVGDTIKDPATGVSYIISGSKTVTYKKPGKKTAALKTVTIPATVKINKVSYKVTAIAGSAFKNNTVITSVTIGKNVQTIGKKAFYNCTALAELTIPAKVTTIGKSSFQNCKKLKVIIIKTRKLKEKTIGSKAFKGTAADAIVIVPKKSLKTYSAWLVKKGLSKKARVLS